MQTCIKYLRFGSMGKGEDTAKNSSLKVGDNAVYVCNKGISYEYQKGGLTQIHSILNGD